MISSSCVDGMREVFHSGTKKLFALINRSLSNQDGMDEGSFQELAADYQRLMGREIAKKIKLKRRSGHAY